MQKSPDEIRSNLVRLIQDSQDTYPNLALRLREMSRWIADKKSGQLVSKKHVMLLLEEFIKDATFWLELQLIPKEDKVAELSSLTPIEMYWYEYLFPLWIDERDPKKETWKKELMAGKFQGNDTFLVDKICQVIVFLGGDTFHSYIADLSMATDLFASGLNNLPLSVQITTIQGTLSQPKQQKWLDTLQYWGIDRGLFVSYNPTVHEIESRIGQEAFHCSDEIPKNCYSKIDIDR
ncbi:hypothetical protein [Nostoc sp.]|uniref:hypothetical protein n=1 Tax=Nostoc sp. TaxID=1180 RepID=UPI002FF4E5DD